MAKSKTSKRYTPEFKRQMVELHRAGGGIPEPALEFAPTPWTIALSVKQADPNAGRDDGGLNISARAFPSRHSSEGTLASRLPMRCARHLWPRLLGKISSTARINPDAGLRRVKSSITNRSFALGFSATIPLLLTAIALGLTPQANNNIRFWLGGEDLVTVKDKHRDEPADFMTLFQPGAPWQHAASRVTAFKISMQFASRASDADLGQLIGDLQRRGIELAIEMGMLRADRGCGRGEGYMPQDLLNLAMKRIKRLGGKLEFVAMDEVVFFGHEKNWPDRPGQVPCQDNLEEIATEVAASVAAIHQYFPQAKIGDTEPLTTNNNVHLARSVQDYLTFADLFRAATGSSLAFLHADIAWRSKNWQPGVAALKAGLQARGIRFGIIIGGNPDQKDDRSWTAAGLNELKILASNPATSPQDVIVQSWQPFPTHYLPETTAGTSTWMLLQAESLLQ